MSLAAAAIISAVRPRLTRRISAPVVVSDSSHSRSSETVQRWMEA